MASEMGFEVAQSNAAWLYDMMGDSLSAEHSASVVRSYQRRHADASDEETKLYGRRMRALRFLYAASQQYSVDAHLRLGDYYYYGFGPLQVDFVIAASYYRRASEMRNSQVGYSVLMLAFGVMSCHHHHHHHLSLSLSLSAVTPLLLCVLLSLVSLSPFHAILCSCSCSRWLCLFCLPTPHSPVTLSSFVTPLSLSLSLSIRAQRSLLLCCYLMKFLSTASRLTLWWCVLH
jgi:hypothetical protein